MQVLIQDFLSFIRSEKALSVNTQQAYQRDLEDFFSFCERKNYALLQVTLKQLRDYLATLRKQDLATRSIARKVSSLKQFYQFQLREGRTQTNPSELLTVTVKSRRLPRHLSVEEIFALIAAAEGTSEAEIRDRALLELWYATGTRVTELAQLGLADIDWTGAVIKVRGKGGRERLIPVHATALEWCGRYRDLRHQWVARFGLRETDRFFLSRQGRGFTRQGIWKIVKKYARRAGLSRNVWPHMIRHSFATHVLQGGADLRAVQELLGHRSIATTEVYTHLDIENLKTMQLKYHPRS